MKRISQSIQQTSAPRQTTFIGDVTAVNILARTINVNIKGYSGPRLVNVPVTMDMGVSQLPKIQVGYRAILDLIDDQFYLRDAIYVPGKATTSASNIPALPAPTNFNIVMGGVMLHASWSYPIPLAVAYYELYQNTSGSPSGAFITGNPFGSARTSGTSYDWSPNTTQGSNIMTINPDFEQGSMNGWFPQVTTNQPGWSIVTSSPYAGTYCLQFDFTPTTSSLARIYSAWYPINLGVVFTYSWRFNFLVDGPPANIVIMAESSDGTGAIANQATIQTYSAVTSGWVFGQGTLIPSISGGVTPVQARYRIESGNYVGSEVKFALDNMSIAGPVTNPETTFYAVRAIGQYGQASPFSTWQTPTIQGAQTSAFQSQTKGALIGPEGLDGNIIPPGDKLSKYFFLS